LDVGRDNVFFFFYFLFCRRRKGKGKKPITETTEVSSQETRAAEPEADEPNETGDTRETPSVVQRDNTAQATNAADTPGASALPSSEPPQASQVRQTTCTPLNTPSHLYGTTPLNTAVTSSLNSPAAPRIPILFGFVTPLESSPAQISQAAGVTARIPGEQNSPIHRNNPGGLLNSPAVPPQGGNLGSMSAQELQQVVISRMLASENTESAFVPPNLTGMSANPPPRPPVLLPHVHSLLNPSGVNSGGEVTVWPFSPNSGMFQQ